MAKLEHPMREIRRVLKKSRPHFAAMIGVSQFAVKRIELGKLNLSVKLARRIMWITGVRHDQLLKGFKGRALTAGGDAFSQGWFEFWQRSRGTQWSADHLIEASLGWARLLLEAATKKGGPSEPLGRLHQVRSALADALDEIVSEFKLRPQIDEELSARVRIEKDPAHVERLKSLWQFAREKDEEEYARTHNGEKPPPATKPAWLPRSPRKLAPDEYLVIKWWEPLASDPPPARPMPEPRTSASRSLRAPVKSKTKP